jgi:hypothetical protein
MERAFSSPRYDSYVNRHWQLTREVWSREHSFSPAVVFYSFWSHSIPDMSSIEAYARIQYREAREALQAGHADQAEALLKQVDSFARLMAAQNTTYIEGMISLALSRKTSIELLHFYQNANRTTESAQASQRLEEIAAAITDSRKQNAPARATHSQDLVGRGWLVDIVTLTGILLLVTAILSLLIVELRSCKPTSEKGIGRAFLCFAADWAPVSCLIACIALLWAFQPFAHILASARTVMTASDAWSTLHHQGLFRLGTAFPVPYYDGVWATYHLWQAATYILAALALFILFRRFLFAKRA